MTFALVFCVVLCCVFQAEDGIRDLVRSRGLGDVYKRQHQVRRARIPRREEARRSDGRRDREPQRHAAPRPEPSLIHIRRCRRTIQCRSRGAP